MNLDELLRGAFANLLLFGQRLYFVHQGTTEQQNAERAGGCQLANSMAAAPRISLILRNL